VKAICVTADRSLELRDIPTPTEPPPGYLLVDIEGSAINHGDKTFLKTPQAAGNTVALLSYNVWGASASGRVVAVGSGVPPGYEGRSVAIYRSLQRGRPVIGLWCERAQVPYRSCLPLPEHLEARAYSGSLVNVITAYAFLEEAVTAGHSGIIVTAGNSATGRALAAFARRRRLPAIILVRTPETKAELERGGIEHVLVMREGFLIELGDLATRLGATAVFDGVGGELVTNMAPVLPMNSTVYFYGFLAGAAPVSLSSLLFMRKNLTLRRFSNFESATVRDLEKLDAALKDIQSCIDHPLFETRVGQEFRLEQFAAAMSYEAVPGAKAVFVP
jgi:NADPH:quinone reductase-like Zn-dependent oxidoreductase